jgi:site-specific DNA-cytosine methylase
VTYTGITLCSGGGLAALGLTAAGVRLVGAVEYDPAIAAVYTANLGDHCTVAPVQEVDYRPWAGVDVLQVSPPCPSFSVAKAGGQETELDTAIAAAIVHAITTIRPRVLWLENVEGYAASTSYRAIRAALDSLDYWSHAAVVNSADYGGFIPCPIHAPFAEHPSVRATAADIVASAAMMQPDDQARSLAWDVAVRWAKVTKWGDAADAVAPKTLNVAPTLVGPLTLDGRAGVTLTSADISTFGLTGSIDASTVSLLNKCLDDPSLSARWSITATAIQATTIRIILKCIAAMGITSGMIGREITQSRCSLCRETAVPQTRRRLILRAVSGGLWQPFRPLPAPVPWVGWYAAIEDLLPTLPESQFAPWQLARLPAELTQAGVLLDSKNAGQEYGKLHRLADEPAITVVTDHKQSHMPRAFLLNTSADKWGDGLRQAGEPAATIRTGMQHLPRAFVVSNSKTEWSDGIRQADEPMLSVTTQTAGRARAWLAQGRVVKMTPRALARFQSVPDAYQLPASAALACRIIGNGVPVLVSQAVTESLLDVAEVAA